MSRYLILVIINTPLVLAALLSALIDFKLGKYSFRKYLWQTAIWVGIFVGLASIKTIYAFLFSNHLTQTEPLSLFDVMQITGIIVVLFMANRARIKVDALERRVQDLHQELSIRLSDTKKAK